MSKKTQDRKNAHKKKSVHVNCMLHCLRGLLKRKKVLLSDLFYHLRTWRCRTHHPPLKQYTPHTHTCALMMAWLPSSAFQCISLFSFIRTYTAVYGHLCIIPFFLRCMKILYTTRLSFRFMGKKKTIGSHEAWVVCYKCTINFCYVYFLANTND